MDAIEFACVMEEIVTSLKVEIDTELVGKIYEQYDAPYENYTLLELITLLKKMKIDITCPWNKKEIIKMIHEKNLKVQKKHEEIEPTVWRHYRVRKSLDVIEMRDTPFEFYEGCIIGLPDGEIYNLDVYKTEELICDELPEDDANSYEDVVYVILRNRKSLEEITLPAQEFINMLDFDDVTILQNTGCNHFMSEEEQTKLTNHVRLM